MNSWFRKIRGALGLGLLWGAGGAVIGGVIELLMNLLPGADDWGGIDMWPQALAIPGFVGGMIFAVVLGVVARGRRFEELSVARFALWGAVGGAVVSGGLVAIGLGHAVQSNLLLRALLFMGPPTLFSAVMSSGSLWVAKVAEARMVGGGANEARRLEE